MQLPLELSSRAGCGKQAKETSDMNTTPCETQSRFKRWFSEKKVAGARVRELTELVARLSSGSPQWTVAWQDLRIAEQALTQANVGVRNAQLAYQATMAAEAAATTSAAGGGSFTIVTGSGSTLGVGASVGVVAGSALVGVGSRLAIGRYYEVEEGVTLNEALQGVCEDFWNWWEE